MSMTPPQTQYPPTWQLPTTTTRRLQLPEGHTLILGGGFGGAHVARLLGRGGATVVSPTSTMLYTPLLPEVAGGAIEPRHVTVPLRLMCPRACLVRGRVVHLDERTRQVLVETDTGPIEIGYHRLVVSMGSTSRMPPLPGLAERAMPFKDVADAVRLRDHVLRMLDLAEIDAAHSERYLTFVFVGAGYAGVEAVSEAHRLVTDALAHRTGLDTSAMRWILVNAGPKILGEVPDGLGAYADRLLRRQGVEVLNKTTLAEVTSGSVTLSDGRRIASETLVWTAGVIANPVVGQLGLPTGEDGRILVDPTLRVIGRSEVWALGDCARVPNAATERPDPPTCQHALRQARHVARTLRGSDRPYRYASVGEGATLGSERGIARIHRVQIRGWLAALFVRSYHLRHVPVRSRRVRILTDGLISQMFRRDTAELGLAARREATS
jgi:NADH:ubiquinone reductase (H+-translocating)